MFTADGETVATLAWYPRNEGNGVTGAYRDDNAKYIALLHPDNVRALCDALAQRDAQIAALTAENLDLKQYVVDEMRFQSPATPATDAAANALRAEGVEWFATALAHEVMKSGEDYDSWKSAASNAAMEYVEQLREGKA